MIVLLFLYVLPKHINTLFWSILPEVYVVCNTVAFLFWWLPATGILDFYPWLSVYAFFGIKYVSCMQHIAEFSWFIFLICLHSLLNWEHLPGKLSLVHADYPSHFIFLLLVSLFLFWKIVFPAFWLLFLHAIVILDSFITFLTMSFRAF